VNRLVLANPDWSRASTLQNSIHITCAVAALACIRHHPTMRRILPAVMLIPLLAITWDKPGASQGIYMTPLEGQSFKALVCYHDCMAPYITAAKKQRLSDNDVDLFGWHCPTELKDAAIKRERYFSTKPGAEQDRMLIAPTRGERVKLHERELARSFYCDLRACYRL